MQLFCYHLGKPHTHTLHQIESECWLCCRSKAFAILPSEAFALCALQMESVFRGLDQCCEEEKLQRLLKLKLRYFTPREVANLMGFPTSFCESNGFISSMCLSFQITYIFLSLVHL